MVELQAKPPCDGLLPVTHGSVTLREVHAGHLTSITPLKGREQAVSQAMLAAHGVAFPAVNRSVGRDGARAIWFSRGQALLIGPAPDAALAADAALTDQSDAWAVVRLDGAGAEDVLARLVPVDLRRATFKRGHTLRSSLMHMTVSITRVGNDTFQIMGFRSMAGTLVHDLETAMEGVAARG